MDKVVVVGNCQAGALEMMLSTNQAFMDLFQFVSFPPVHEIPQTMVPEIHRAVADATVLISQRIDEGYRDGIGLGTDTLVRIAVGATVVRWPSVYWAGYFPDLFYLRDSAGQPIVEGPFDYHDRVILQAYISGIDVLGTCHLLEDQDRPSDAQAWAAKATAELDLRGQDCDIDIAPFIASQFQDELLFLTMNHPTNHMLGFIAQQIVEFIGVSGNVDHRRIPDEVLGSTFYPFHANHAHTLGLRFGAKFVAGNAPFKIRGVTYKPAQAVQMFFDYYDAHPELVELNLDPVSRDINRQRPA